MIFKDESTNKEYDIPRHIAEIVVSDLMELHIREVMDYPGVWNKFTKEHEQDIVDLWLVKYGGAK